MAAAIVTTMSMNCMGRLPLSAFEGKADICQFACCIRYRASVLPKLRDKHILGDALSLPRRQNCPLPNCGAWQQSSATDLPPRCSRSRMPCPETDWVGKSHRGPGPFDSTG